MASKKKSSAKKTTEGRKKTAMRDLPKGKKGISGDQIEAVKGGTIKPVKYED